MQIFIAFPRVARVWLLRHHPPGPAPRWTYCAPSLHLLPTSPQKRFYFYCVSVLHCIFKPTPTCKALAFFIYFFFPAYVLITQSLVLLNRVMTFVLCVSLWLEKALAKASLKRVSGCTERDVCARLCWLGVLGHRDRRKKQLSHTAKIIAFCLFFSKSIRAKSPAHWSPGKDSHCFAQLWIKATVQRHAFSGG